jgi:hypothetical protein
LSTVEREEAVRWRSSVVGRKDEGEGSKRPGAVKNAAPEGSPWTMRGSEENSTSGEYDLVLFLEWIG